MTLFKSTSGPVPSKTSYRKELARLKESNPFCTALVRECVKSLLPQEAVYLVAVRDWYFLNQKDKSYLAKALGPDEDFSYIDEHLTLATERTESIGIDLHFEELVATGVLKPLSGYAHSNDSTNMNDSDSSDAVVQVVPKEINSNDSTHSPAQSPVFPFSPGPLHNLQHPDGANLNEEPTRGSFFGQTHPDLLGSQNFSISAENLGKTETVASRRWNVGTGGQGFGTSPANQQSFMPSSAKPAKGPMFGNSFYL